MFVSECAAPLNRSSKRWDVPVFAAMMWVVSATPTWAYLDPGTGSILLQAIVGTVAAAALILRQFWARLMELFGVRHASPPPVSEEPHSVARPYDNK